MNQPEAEHDQFGSPPQSRAMRYKKFKKRAKFNERAIIVVLDICSSTQMLEELTERNRIDLYQDSLIAKIKQYLAQRIQIERNIFFHPYKFLGDGWILVFPAATTPNDGVLLEALRELCTYFREESARFAKLLNSPPSITGLTFGVDVGEIRQMIVYEDKEWVGMCINVASRLQGENKDAANKALVTTRVFEEFMMPANGFQFERTTRPLRNVRGVTHCQCVEIQLL